MKCLRCGNENPQFFYTDEFSTYCRKCVMFSRLNVGSKPKKIKLPLPITPITYQLPYNLSPKQLEISQAIIDNLTQKQDCFVHACCGSGKTEIILPVITHLINTGKTVGIAIPRRQVVIELHQRLSEAFKDLNVIAVCEGHTRKIKGELVICTTHQLYRYYQSFNVLIIDEIDAFPFYSNTTLNRIAHDSYRDNIIMLSATLPKKMHPNIKILRLYQRYHTRKIPIPKIRIMPLTFQILTLFFYLKKYLHLTILIFFPTIKLVNKYYKIIKKFYPCFMITSESQDKELILKQLHQSQTRILCTTTIMERGITIADACVIVFNTAHHVFSSSCLIQIAGRVDRKPTSYNAPVIFLSNKYCTAIKQCLATLKEMNQ